MRHVKQLSGLLAAAAVAATGVLGSGVATAATHVEHYPETPELNPKLPIVETTRGSDHIKANILNPHPVCNSAEDFRTTVYEVKDNFLPAGTISATNKSNATIPLTQDLSKSQSISISIQGDRTETTTANLGGGVSGDNSNGSIGISKSIAEKIGAQFSYTLSWDYGQTIGPYDVPPGYTGEATYGFRAINLNGTQQYCRPNGTWSTPTPWRVFQPVKNEVQVKLYDDPVDSWQGTVDEPKVDTDVAAPEVQDGKAEPVVETTPVDPEDANATGNATAKADIVQTASETGLNETDKAEAGKADLDLEPYLTTSSWKAPGYAGIVALHVRNVGAKRYFDESYPATFRIEVHTDEGPEGVDRLITPDWFNGAYSRDLGFDPETSTRTFEVTLSNPINAGDDTLVANLQFGDGDTKEGRLFNYVTVTQVGRANGDTSEGNDQQVDSREAGNTVTDFGNPNKGIF